MNKLQRAVSIICLLMMPVGQIGVDIYMPSLPHMAAAFQSTNTTIQLSVTLYLISLGFSLLATGPFADRFGRYPFLLLGLGLYSFMALAGAMATSVCALLIYRLLQGLGAGMVITSARACVSDQFSGQQLSKVVTNMTIVWSSAPILAPYIGGYLQQYVGWYANFYFMFFYAAVLLGLAVWFLTETIASENRHPVHPKRLIKNFKRVVSTREFIGYITIMSAAYMYLVFFNVTAPFLLQDQLGIMPARYGQFILFAGLFYLFGTLLTKVLITKVQAKYLVLAGGILCVLASFSQLVLSFVNVFTVSSVIFPAYVAFVGVGLIYPNGLASAMSYFRDIAGAASSVIGFIPMVGCAVITIVAAKLPETSALPFAAVSFIMMLLGLVIYIPLCLRRRHPAA